MEGTTTLHLASFLRSYNSLRLQASSQSMASSVVSAQHVYSKAMGPKLEYNTLNSIFWAIIAKIRCCKTQCHGTHIIFGVSPVRSLAFRKRNNI